MKIAIEEVEGGIVVPLRVQPRSSRNKIAGLQGEALKIKLTSPPVEGKANSQCLSFLAKWLGLSPSRLTLLAGEKCRDKRVRIEGIGKKRFIEKLKDEVECLKQ